MFHRRSMSRGFSNTVGTSIPRFSRTVFSVALCLALLMPCTLSGQDANQAGAAQGNAAEVPELSIETLFSPKESFNYFGAMPPATQWLSDSRLAVKRGETWEVISPESGEVSKWSWPEELRAELGKLTEFSPELLDAAAATAVSSAQDLEKSFMVRIDNGIAVIGGGSPPRVVSRDAKGWEHPELSPDGKAIAYVRNHDLYVMYVASGETLRLTNDGSPTLLNGHLDWTYQEEIYGRGNFKGFWWSPDSKHLAFLKIDIANVLPFTLTRSRDPRGEAIVTPYPKAGDPIPAAELWVVDTESLQMTAIHQPVGDEAESLVVRVTWRPDGKRLTYQIQNRIQSWLELRQADLASPHPQVLVREEGPAWVEILGEPHWLPGGDFLWLSDLPAGRRHLWRISSDGARSTPITFGAWDVRDVVQVLPESQEVFVTGDRLQEGKGQQLMLVRLGEHHSAEETPQLLTHEFGWHAASVSPDGRFFTDTHSTVVDEPVKYLVSVSSALSQTELPADGSIKPGLWLRLGPDAEKVAPWKRLGLSEPKWLDFKTSDGVRLGAYEIQPKMKANDPNRRYPVLIYTYGGPQAPSAVDRWNGRNLLFHQLLASHGIGVVVVDNRSSGGRGIADTWSIYRRVGVQEMKDLLDAVSQIKALPWVDAERLALRGWSFGGFYTAYAMTHSDQFRAGIAGGSVTDWRNYDAFYTERYMDTPQANEAGYRETSVIGKAGDLHGRLLLIHGEVDDNVHPGNTLQLVEALQDAGKSFDLMIYPGAAHGVVKRQQVYHLHKLMFEFLKRELQEN